MKLRRTKVILLAATIFSLTLGEAWGVASFAQNVGINTTGNAPNSSALLDINASPGNNKGVLIPRLPLTGTNSGAPISPLPGAAETGLMVFNTATAGVAPNDVVPGFYYWNGTAWAPLGAGGSTAGGWTDDGTVVRLTTSTDFVGIGTVSPAATSALDITSTTKGILIPRMTTAQRDAITTPASGLQIYNTDCKSLNYYTGTCWISMSKSLPDPGIITSTPATTVFCAGQVRTYSVPAVPGATSYIWSVPAGTSITSGNGTTSISATFGNISGDVCVKASNSCETSGQTCIAVSVDPIPNTPGNITGITSINPGQTSVTYFVASVNGASTYTWTVPAGATIASGTGTTTIVVNFACNASSGNISVTANSTCGSSPASALALTITPLLAVSAGSPVFGGTTQTIGNAATGGTAGYTYAWLPTANLSASNIVNPIAQCTGATTTYTVTATDSRSCTATSTVVVTRNLAVNAGAGVFAGTTQTIGNAATGGAAGYSYAWLPASNLSSYTIAGPIAQCAGSTTTYTLTATDANSCTATSTVIVTRNLVASAGANQSITCAGVGIGGSPTATGGNATYTYSWSPTAGLSSATVANPTSGVCPTATYTVTITDANGCTATSTMVLTKNPCTVTFNYTGAAQTWTVPACVTLITIDANGAQGSTANAGAGGSGGRAQGTLVVTPGATINVYVGGQAGFNGGGAGGAPGGVVGAVGGGASDLRIGGVALANRVVVAGGGGGGGAAGGWSGGAGGVGGGTTGGAGGPSNGGSPFGGQGGSQVAGGTTGGGCGCCAGTAGSLGLGGVGANSSSWASGGAGGGGGGYYGGGAGHVCGSGDGGGGGSSYIVGLGGGSTTSGVRAGNGQIIITY